MIVPAGHQIITDWGFMDGMWMSATSVLSNVNYLVSALQALSNQNTNVILSSLNLNPQVGSYYDSSAGTIYYYFTIEATIDLTWSMLNGDWEWETDTIVGSISGYIWVGIDYTTDSRLWNEWWYSLCLSRSHHWFYIQSFSRFRYYYWRPSRNW
ncbi:MAG: hypothetical protein ACTSP3_14910 [Candidatus Heimdallarchaeaceae archaeon]